VRSASASAASGRRHAPRKIERDRRLAVARERTRIARDLHDSAGHAINVILMQAAAARLAGERDPAAARDALQTTEDVARETIDEIDRLVGALREDGAGGLRAPRGLAAVDGLVAERRAAGLDVTFDRRGAPLLLDAGADQAAYGILREALTNAARHGAGMARVDLAFGAATVALTVTNPLRAGGAPGPERHGIVGMRERALLAGGTLTAAPDGDGGFRVRTELPAARAVERP
jgi:signal transduction histidine kinase